ncbi:MAG: carboxymuconolactone decarboxylase family protein [bacterium]|jgi:4-carboxymuconolactone decarboxylase|nr:carboxymuconolactone decarboxylase family protein [Betaproteobacteria bacterium]
MNDDRSAFLRLYDESGRGLDRDTVLRRPGIDERTRALLGLAMVAARCEDTEVPAHVRRCVAQGLGRSEVGEALLQVYCYAGVYAGLSSFTAARATFDAMEAAGELPPALAAVRNPPAPSTTVADRTADGARMRRTLFGDENVDRNEREADDFMNLFWSITHDFCFGNIWSRPLFERPLRSQLCLAIASAAGQVGAVDRHVRSALRGGVSGARIGEIFILAGALASAANGRAAFERALQVFDELGV